MEKGLIEILPDGKMGFDCKHEEPSSKGSGEGNTEEKSWLAADSKMTNLTPYLPGKDCGN